MSLPTSDWHLRETPEQRKVRAIRMRFVYAWTDPRGWDAHRWSAAVLRAIGTPPEWAAEKVGRAA